MVPGGRARRTRRRRRGSLPLDRRSGPRTAGRRLPRIGIGRPRPAVVTAQEEERRRLRRDLHDGVGPTLTGVSMALHTVVRRMRRGSSDAYDVTLLAQLADEVDRTVGDVKRIVRDLLPTALDDQGLAAALAEFARNFEGVIDID